MRAYRIEWVRQLRYQAWGAALPVELLGRFAEFDYINSDECFHRAMRMAERINQDLGYLRYSSSSAIP